MPFLNAIEEAGTESQSEPRKAIKILKEVSVEIDGKRVTLEPANDMCFLVKSNLTTLKSVNQTFTTQLVNGNFRHDIAEAPAHSAFCMKLNGCAHKASRKVDHR